MFVLGQGRAWIDDVTVEVVGDDVAITGGGPPASRASAGNQMPPKIREALAALVKDLNRSRDVYVKDLLTGAIVRASSRDFSYCCSADKASSESGSATLIFGSEAISVGFVS